MINRYLVVCLSILWLSNGALAQTTRSQSSYLLKPSRLFDGEIFHEGWQLLVRGDKIEAIGANLPIPKDAQVIDLQGKTLLPGLIEGHSHLLLHPYNETSWDDQVLKESNAERIARAVVHANKTLLAGFTTVRDLGTEGSAYDDVGLKQTIEKGIIPGPRLITAGRALVATGSYGPKVTSPEIDVPQGAEESDGHDALVKSVRTQIGKGIDVVKIYADYRWGLFKDAQPTFLQEEIELIVRIAASSGRQVVAHASTAEGMRRAILGGCATIEHGDGGTVEIFRLMKERGVALCPTIAAGDAVSQYRGWKKGLEPDPERIQQKRKSFKTALDAGVTICMGGDVGVFTHGDNAREMEMMVAYGMKPIDVLKAATSVNADVFRVADRIGRLKTSLLADLIAVEGNPEQAISDVRKVVLVMKNGIIYKNEKP